MIVGAALPVGVTYGYRRGSSWEQYGGDGCDFVDRVAEDLALLAELGVTDVRLGVDWTWCQPMPTGFDPTATEHLGEVMAAANGLGIGVWPSLFEGPVPGWFADEGGFSDERASGLSWPRYVEAVAERIGDEVAGWFPMLDPVGHAERGYRLGIEPPFENDPARHRRCLRNMLVAWRDSWRILRGGPPVVPALEAAVLRAAPDDPNSRQDLTVREHLMWHLWGQALTDGIVRIPGLAEVPIQDLAAGHDAWGVLMGVDLGDDVTAEPGQELPDEVLQRWEDRAGTLLRRSADAAPATPLCVAGFRLPQTDGHNQVLLAEAFGRALHGAAGDGVSVMGGFVSPAIADTDRSDLGLVSRNRDIRSIGGSWAGIVAPGPSS
jgi:hypothetical protein